MTSIKHAWLDFSDTIASINEEEQNKLRYAAYASITGKEVNQDLIAEYKKLLEEHKKSNAAVFRSLGMPTSYWSEQINAVDPAIFFRLADERIPQVLQELKELVPLSIFSNIELRSVLPSLGIDLEWFTHIISADMVKEPKPALDGFYKIVELSGVPAEQILYVGDDVGKDILPAKQVGLLAGIIWSQTPEADYNFKNFDDLLKLFKAN